MLQRQILVALLVATGLVEAALLRGHNGPTSSIIERGSLIARQNRGGQGQGRGGQNNGNNGGNGGQQNNNGGQQNNNGGQNNNNGGGACLAQNSRQAASNTDGQETGTEGIKAGQAKSLTDGNNFINFCSGKTITDGKQQKGGSCNPTPMGQLPAQNKMVTTIITNPKPGDKLPAGQTFKIDVQTKNLQAGSFTNPTTTYYTAPQQLNGQGEIIGHAHVTVQEIGSLTPNNPPNAAQFAFFKGIDDAGNGQGLLSASVDGGLPAGVYRVCTIMSASNHQNVAMPIAQRGAQDDCTKFEVTNGGGGGGNNNGQNNNGQNNNGQNRNQGNQGQNRQGGQQGRGGRKA